MTKSPSYYLYMLSVYVSGFTSCNVVRHFVGQTAGSYPAWNEACLCLDRPIRSAGKVLAAFAAQELLEKLVMGQKFAVPFSAISQNETNFEWPICNLN